MEVIREHMFLLDSLVIWAILLIAVISYALLFDLCFFKKHDSQWHESTVYWATSIKQMLASLPLLGLLGTITGLLSTFTRMSREHGFALQEIITGGIAEAMFTTQLGLVMTVPGLLLLALLNRQKITWMVRHTHEIID